MENYLDSIENNTWVGFTGYRYHWSQKNSIGSDELTKIINKDNFENYVLKEIPDEWKLMM